MKIKKFNENIEYSLPKLSINNEENHKLVLVQRNKMKHDIDTFMKNNGDIIKFKTEEWIHDPDNTGHAPNIYGISPDNVLYCDENFNEDSPKIYISDIEISEDLVEIMTAINNNYIQTYEYQKLIITKNPKEITNIIPHLNAKIKKEYPHLTSGKDLNLL